ncbi:MAG: hypothetical protein IJS32_01190 [Kiritimatiellae bacterium]|nr:hypothetical protein [Kiritimatiellia bacterium]
MTETVVMFEERPDGFDVRISWRENDSSAEPERKAARELALNLHEALAAKAGAEVLSGPGAAPAEPGFGRPPAAVDQEFEAAARAMDRDTEKRAEGGEA